MLTCVLYSRSGKVEFFSRMQARFLSAHISQISVELTKKDVRLSLLVASTYFTKFETYNWQSLRTFWSVVCKVNFEYLNHHHHVLRFKSACVYLKLDFDMLCAHCEHNLNSSQSSLL